VKSVDVCKESKEVREEEEEETNLSASSSSAPELSPSTILTAEGFAESCDE